MVNIASLFLKEPGRSIISQTRSLGKTKVLKALSPGTELKLQDKGYRLFSEKEIVSQIEEEAVIKKINYALEKGFVLKFFLVKTGKENTEVMIRCERPIFLDKSGLEIKPFTKHEEFLEENLLREGVRETDDDNPEFAEMLEENESPEA